jgi:hypothetical protein
LFQSSQVARAILERQIKDLRERLNSNDGSVSESIKTKLSTMEAQNRALEQQIDNEVRYVMTYSKSSDYSFYFVEKNKRLYEVIAHWKNAFVKQQLL